MLRKQRERTDVVMGQSNQFVAQTVAIAMTVVVFVVVMTPFASSNTCKKIKTTTNKQIILTETGFAAFGCQLKRLTRCSGIDRLTNTLHWYENTLN